MLEIKGTGKEIRGFVELEITDGGYQGITFYYEDMKFADEPNEDGTITMSFDYTITSEPKPEFNEEEKQKFANELGETIISILEEQLKRNEVVFAGGTDDGIVANPEADSGY